MPTCRYADLPVEAKILRDGTVALVARRVELEGIAFPDVVRSRLSLSGQLQPTWTRLPALSSPRTLTIR